MPFLPIPKLGIASFSAGRFLFVLDGAPMSCYIKSVEGGTVKGSIIEEQIGPDFTKFKHLATVEVEPISLQLGLGVSKSILNWIQASWTHHFERKNGSIIHADHKYDAVYEQEFMNALVAETTFPALDGSEKGPAYLTVKLHPESLWIKKTGGSLRSILTPKQKLWSPSNFRFWIDGIDTSRIAKIDSFSVKQKIKPLYFGSKRHPELEPTGLEYSNITLYTSLAHADDFIKWHQQFVVEGDKDPNQEREGEIQYLDPRGDDKEPLMSLKLHNLGIYSLTIEKSEANADSIKRCKIELYVERMELWHGMALE